LTGKKATDWDRYYQSVPFTAKLTRRYSTAVLLDAMNRYAALDRRLAIAEIGGANSCFMESILAKIPCRSYDVIDTNSYGLSLLANKAGLSPVVRLHQQNVLGLSLDSKSDVVFSVGLVEHFDTVETRQAVLSHFDVLRSGGIAIITFPTPTWLYRASRKLIEAFGMWKFPDERPLNVSEVATAVKERAAILDQRTLWPQILTQHIIVARNYESPIPPTP
jgi:hypothetical protein